MPNNTTLEQDGTPTAMPEQRGENFRRTSCPNTNNPTTHKPEAGGQGLTGTVVAISAEQVFVDIGHKIEGVMPVAAFKDAAGK